jgi:hypothetical protein
MKALVRNWNAWSVALALAGGAWMRLWMLKAIPQITFDTLLYGNLAKNLLQGRFAMTDGNGVAHETLIRLPGYPLLLAACFRLFGVDNYNAVSYVQIALELAGCLLLAGFVRRIARPAYRDGAAHWTLWIAALCPFTAAYAVAPLTETSTLFAIALALWALARFVERPRWGDALAFTFAVCFAALLRPDGALVGVALAPALLLGLRHASIARGRLVRMGIVCVVLALIPFGVWTARNWRVFHVFMPLAPRYATDENLVLGLCFDLRRLLECAGADARLEQAAGAGIRLAGSVCGDGCDCGSVRRQRTGSFAGTRCALCAARRRAGEGPSAAILRVAAARAHGGHVAAAARRELEHRPRLVGL